MSHATSRPALRPVPAGWARATVPVLGWVAALGALAFVIGLFVEPQRAWTGLLIGFHALVALALAGPVGLAFLHLSGGRWARAIECVPRAMAGALPAAAAAGAVLLFGIHSLFEWSHATAVADDVILAQKAAYLNTPFFALRLVVFFAIWIWAGRRVVRASAEAPGDTPAERRRRLRAAAVFLLLFAPTWSLASIDWLQSLEPHWFSTIYALLTLAGLAVGGVAAVIVLAAARDTHDEVSDDQWGDLGALLLALALFWAYIWYSQYLLVWYTNLPEETPWYEARLGAEWGLLTKAACVLCGALPFTLLLFRRLRRSRRALVRIAAVVLAGRLVDLWVLAGPPLMGATPRLGPFEVLPVLGAVALFFCLVLRALRRPEAAPAAVAGSVPSPLPGVHRA